MHKNRQSGAFGFAFFVLSEIHSSNPRSACFKRCVAEAFHLVDVAEFFADEFAEDAVAFAVEDAHFLDAEEFGFVQIFVDDVQGFIGAFAAHV